MVANAVSLYPSTVHDIVSAALQAHTAESVDFLCCLQDARPNALQRELCPKADTGEIAAIDQIRKIVLTQVRLHGLIGAGSDAAGSVGANRRDRPVGTPPRRHARGKLPHGRLLMRARD